MEHNEDLARLELLFEKLIESHNKLKKEKNEMIIQLQEKQQEIFELQEKVKNLQEDRSEMHNQVTGLIGRIGEWEKIIDQENAQQENGSRMQAQDMTKESNSLFNVASEQ